VRHQKLPVEVAGLDVAAVRDHHPPDSGRGQFIGR
jgi:hypothetical protein